MKDSAGARLSEAKTYAPAAHGATRTAQTSQRIAALQRAADASAPVAQLTALQLAAAPLQLGRDKNTLIKTRGESYKKKEKERRVAKEVEASLDETLSAWIDGYGHAEERHSGLTTQQLDARNIPLATTFDTRDDLFRAAKDVITVNEAKINHWYENTEEERLPLWSYRPDDVIVRGRRKQKRPDWHQHANPMPPHPGFVDADPDDLRYVIAVFDRDAWSLNPKGLVTCFPSETTPS